MEFYDLPFSWECHHPNWLHIFQRGRIPHFKKARASLISPPIIGPPSPRQENHQLDKELKEKHEDGVWMLRFAMVRTTYMYIYMLHLYIYTYYMIYFWIIYIYIYICDMYVCIYILYIYYIMIYLGKFDHDRTLFSRSLVHHGFIGKSCPNGRTIQINELL